MQHSFRTDGISVRTMLEAALVFIYNGEVLFPHIGKKYVTVVGLQPTKLTLCAMGKSKPFSPGQEVFG